MFRNVMSYICDEIPFIVTLLCVEIDNNLLIELKMPIFYKKLAEN